MDHIEYLIRPAVREHWWSKYESIDKNMNLSFSRWAGRWQKAHKQHAHIISFPPSQQTQSFRAEQPPIHHEFPRPRKCGCYRKEGCARKGKMPLINTLHLTSSDLLWHNCAGVRQFGGVWYLWILYPWPCPFVRCPSLRFLGGIILWHHFVFPG